MAACKLWAVILDLPHDGPRSNAVVQGPAILCLTYNYLAKFNRSHNGLYLTEAARCANRAAILKESAGVMCHTARLLSDTVKILATGKRRLNHVASICKVDSECIPLKRYLERRDRAIEESTRARAHKEARAPNHYKCARNDCGIRATSQRALYKCGGPCAPEVEPHYCSKECQKLVCRR